MKHTEYVLELIHINCNYFFKQNINYGKLLIKSCNSNQNPNPLQVILSVVVGVLLVTGGCWGQLDPGLPLSPILAPKKKLPAEDKKKRKERILNSVHLTVKSEFSEFYYNKSCILYSDVESKEQRSFSFNIFIVPRTHDILCNWWGV